MTTTINTALAEQLAVLLNLRTQANPDPETPFDSNDLDSMINGAGILKSADLHPAKQMLGTWAGAEMEAARHQALDSRKKDRSAKRMARARKMTARKEEFNEIIAAPAPDRERLDGAWMVVVMLLPLIERITASKRRWAARHLGSVTDDIEQVVIEQIAMVLAKSSLDLDVTYQDAVDIIKDKERKDVDLSPEEKRERKAAGKRRGWLVSLVNNRVMDALKAMYREPQHFDIDTYDRIETVMANISGVGDDPLTDRFKADRAPAFLGARFQRPGGIDPNLLTSAVQAAISHHNLDDLTDVLLKDEHRRSDGSVAWTKIAEQVFLASPDGRGEHYWSLVTSATEGKNRASKMRGRAAMQFTRGHFQWLPQVIVGVQDAFDYRMIGWSTRGGMAAINVEKKQVRLERTAIDRQRHAVMASAFELDYLAYYQPDEPMGAKRSPLRPSLTFATVEDAAAALADILENA